MTEIQNTEPIDPTEVLPKPEPVLAGTFAIYQLPDGGMIVAYRPTDEEESQQIHIPAFAMKMLTDMQNGGGLPSMGQMMKLFMGG